MIKQATIRVPYAVGDCVVIMVNLQHTLIFHNDHGLVAIAVEHCKKMYVHKGLPLDVEKAIDKVEANPPFDHTGYEVVRVDLRTTEYYTEIKDPRIHNDLAAGRV